MSQNAAHLLQCMSIYRKLAGEQCAWRPQRFGAYLIAHHLIMLLLLLFPHKVIRLVWLQTVVVSLQNILCR